MISRSLKASFQSFEFPKQAEFYSVKKSHLALNFYSVDHFNIYEKGLRKALFFLVNGCQMAFTKNNLELYKMHRFQIHGEHKEISYSKCIWKAVLQYE